MDYHIRVMQEFRDEGVPLRDIPPIRVIIIYTGDVKRSQVRTSFKCGSMGIEIEAAFLSELPKDDIRAALEGKISSGEDLSPEELLELMIFPMAYETSEKKQEMIKYAVNLAKGISDGDTQSYALSGILVFCSKMISAETYDEVRRMISMTRIGELFEAENNLTDAARFVGEIHRAASGFHVSVDNACAAMGHSMDEYNNAVTLLQNSGRSVPAVAVI